MVRPATETRGELSLLSLQSYTEELLVEAHKSLKEFRDGLACCQLALTDTTAAWPAGCNLMSVGRTWMGIFNISSGSPG